VSARRRHRRFHVGLHAFLLTFTALATYPVFWVFSVAFSGTQSLGFADVPSNPGFLDRLRAVVPWPAHWSAKNFADVMTEQPFLHWLTNSAVVAAATTAPRPRSSACSSPAPPHTHFPASAFRGDVRG
jgi:arabinogalactan oligomer / maltooligosaccharide transport system permease protein